MPDGDQPPRPGPRKRPPGRPAAPAQKRSGDPARPAAPRRPDDARPAGAPAKKAKKAAKKRPAGAPGAGPGSGERRGTRPEGTGAPSGTKATKATKATTKRPAGAPRPSSADPDRSRRPRPPGARPEAAEAGRPAGAPAKKAKKAAKKRPPQGGSRPRPEGRAERPDGAPAETRPQRPRPTEGRPSGAKGPAEPAPAKRAGAKRAPSRKAPAKKAPAKKAGPVLHDWAAEHDDEWADATAAVPAADLLAPSSRPVVVRGERPDGRGAGEPAEPHTGWASAVEAPEPDLLPDGDPLGPGVHERDGAKPVRVTRSGKVKKLRGKHKRIYKAKKKPASRLLNHYDVNGPRIRLGFLWFVLVSLAIGAETGTDLPFLAVVYGSAAGFAGWQAAREWNKRTAWAPVQWASAAIGLAVGIAGAASPGVVGLAVFGMVPVALAAVVIDPKARESVAGSFGLTVQCGLFPGIAAAAMALTWRVEPGAAIALFLLVSAYEVGDYVVGSGSLNAFEGPIAGVLAVAAIMLPLYAVQLPPINPDTVITFGVIIAAGCPLSQIVGSAVLPWSDAPAPALRRLDSLILTGPAWLVAVYLENGVL